MNRTIGIIVVILIVVGLVWWMTAASRKTTVPNATGTPSTSTPVVTLPTIQEFVRTHIATLLPKATTSPITVVNVAAQNGTGTVRYTIVGKPSVADFKYLIDANGMPVVTEFIVRP
jgi:cytochrome oxidase Cu insertion factor (SCO1/SenC/PrrC family)